MRIKFEWRTRVALLIAGILVFGFAAARAQSDKKNTPASSIVLATINGEPITLDEVDMQTRFSAHEGLLQSAVQILIIEKVMLQEAAKRGMTIDKVPRQEVLDQMAQEKRKLTELFGSRSVEKIEQLFKNKDFNAALELMVRKKIVIDWLLEDQKRKLVERINVDDSRVAAEIKKLENEKRAVRVRLIVTKDKKTAEQALAAVRSGSMTFQQAASKYSSDKKLAERGGDVGYIERGMVEKAIEDVVFGLGVGQISNVFETSAGFNIAKVEEIQLWKEVPDKLRESVIRKEGVTDLVDLLNKWKKELFTKVKVQYVVPTMAPLKP